MPRPKTKIQSENCEKPHLPYWLMTIRFGELVNETLLKWSDEVLSTMNEMKDHKCKGRVADKSNLTTGSIFWKLLKFSSPIMFGMLIFTLYLLTDLWFVGRLGPDAITALSISSNVFFIHLGLSFIIGTGAMSLIAQGIGAKDSSLASLVSCQP